AGIVTVNAGGAVAPGSAAGLGTLTTGSAAFLPGSTLSVGADGTNTDTDASRGRLFSAAGALTFGGTAASPFTVSVAKAGSFAESDTASYTVAEFPFGGIGSTGLDGAPVVVTAPGGGGMATATNANNIRLDVSGFAAPHVFTLARSGNALVVSFAPVPEPAAALAVLAAGLAAAGWWRRRSSRDPHTPRKMPLS